MSKCVRWRKSSDNRWCINTDHLIRGTRKENMQDASEKGRLQKEESRWGAKLTDRKVREIRKKYKKGVGVCQLAREYGVSHTTIRSCVDRRTWKHI